MCNVVLDNSSCEANGSRIEIIGGDLISSDNLLKAVEACSGVLMSIAVSADVYAKSALSLTEQAA